MQKANSETQADNIFDETKNPKEECKNSVSKSDSEEIQKILDNTNESENNTTRKESPKTPWDSKKKIVLSKEQFMGLCDSINVLDLSNNNSDKKYLIETQKEIIEKIKATKDMSTA